jgi:uncharacterized OB-fold protein
MPGLRSVAANLFEAEDGVVHLLGARRRADGKIIFPIPCDANAELYDRVRLPREGTLWSFTVQRFRPKSPPYAGSEVEQGFVPYAVGYVELPGQIIVESRLQVDDFAELQIGMPMQLEGAAFAHTDGDALTYVFRPAGGQATSALA